MAGRHQLYFGCVPVPYTASWSAEESTLHLAECEWAHNTLAICQKSMRGVGKPVFGKPHMVRQREVITQDLCDLCAKPLRNFTKVSLSHAAVRAHGAQGPAVLQVEPLLHRHCAAISLQHCPSLRRDIEHGTLHVRRVQRHRVQLATMKPESVAAITGSAPVVAVGHAKVELLQWRGMDMNWLQDGWAA